MKKLEFFGKLVLVILSSTIGLILAVMGAEFWLESDHSTHSETNWRDPNTRFDSELGWSPIPSRSIKNKWGKITHNQHGFRSPEIDANKKHIILLGDSVVWGFGIDDDETLSSHLNRKLSQTAYQVHNLGVSGYGIGQYYLYLKRNIHLFSKLDSVILNIYLGNDLRDTGSNSRYGKRKPLIVIKNKKLNITSTPIDKYCLRNLLDISLLLKKIAPQGGRMREFLNKRSGDVVINKFQTFKTIQLLLRKIRQLVNARGAKLVVTVSPSRQFLYSPMSTHIPKMQLARLLKIKEYVKQDLSMFLRIIRNGGYHFIDYSEYLNNEDNDRIDKLYYDFYHFSDAGNEYLSQIVIDYISLLKSKKLADRLTVK